MWVQNVFHVEAKIYTFTSISKSRSQHWCPKQLHVYFCILPKQHEGVPVKSRRYSTLVLDHLFFDISTSITDLELDYGVVSP